RRHTRCLSDWSSDVCSSDLAGTALFLVLAPGVVAGLIPWLLTQWESFGPPRWLEAVGWAAIAVGAAVVVETFVRFVVEGVGTPRSEERRVGKEWGWGGGEGG